MAESRENERLRARYRELATEEPSAALDAAIRAAARRAVGSGPAVIARPRPMRWAVPASVAAVLFLSFGVVIRMEQEVPPLEISSAPPEAPLALRKEAAPAEAKDAIADARVNAPAKPPAPAPSAPKLAEAPAQKPAEAKAKTSPIKPTIVATPPPPEAAPVPAPPPPATPAAAVPAAARPAAPAVSVPAPAAMAPARPAPQAGVLASEPRAFSDSSAARAPAEEQRSAESRARRDETVGAAGLAAQAPRAKTEASAPQRAATTPASEREAPWPDTIEKKLERIETLRKAGRDREADEAIARFRREHPDYRVPDAVWERIKPR